MTTTSQRPARTHHDEASRARHRRGFWVVVGAFTVLMAFTTLPTPLYPSTSSSTASRRSSSR